MDTEFIDRVLAEGLLSEDEAFPEAELAAMLASALEATRRAQARVPLESPRSGWRTAGREALLNRWPLRNSRRV
jgi:hypothetical protein